MQLKGAVTMRKRLFICLLITLVVFTGCKKDKEYQVISVAMGHSCFDCDLTFKTFEIKKDIELNKTITLFGNTIDLEYDCSYFNSLLIPWDAYDVKYVNGVPCEEYDSFICFSADGNIANIACASAFSFAANLSATKEDRAAALLKQLEGVFDIDPSYNKIKEIIKDDTLRITIGNDDSKLTERYLGIVCNKYNGRVLQVVYKPPISENLTKEKILSKKDVFPSVKKKVLEMKRDDVTLESIEIEYMTVVEYKGKLYYYCDVDAEITQNGKDYASTDTFTFMIPV